MPKEQSYIHQIVLPLAKLEMSHENPEMLFISFSYQIVV